MGFFSSLFWGGSSAPSYAKDDSADIWPAKFLTIVITETGNEAPLLQQVKEIIGALYPDLPETDLLAITTSVGEMNYLVSSSKTDWDAVWDDFSAQLRNYKNSESFTIVRKVAQIAFLLKMEEGMREVAQTYVSRIGSHVEKYTLVSKSDFIAIMEEEKENTGYNDYLNSL